MDSAFHVSSIVGPEQLQAHWAFPPGNPKDCNAWIALYNVNKWQKQPTPAKPPKGSFRLSYKFISRNGVTGDLVFDLGKMSAAARVAAAAPVVFALHSLNDQVVAFSKPFRLDVSDAKRSIPHKLQERPGKEIESTSEGAAAEEAGTQKRKREGEVGQDLKAFLEEIGLLAHHSKLVRAGFETKEALAAATEEELEGAGMQLAGHRSMLIFYLRQINPARCSPAWRAAHARKVHPAENQHTS
eukprot:TRINITY_DN9486_c0_g1_i3.p2 TRINITY_DN9486_c0_g1~~TRINITY_DN9486_c0_g1_i3.p2  ORF type:complete len:242 (-),score=40.36 TRINITY_DN9486_c0_g1_i3:355-1080(-)